MRDKMIAEYLAHGWKLCRIHPGQKAPRDTGWNQPGHEIRAVEGFPLGYGVGLLHAWSGTCAFDIDAYDETDAYLKARSVDLGELIEADDAVRVHSGRPDSAKLLYALPTPRVSVQAKKDDKVIFELRCAAANGNAVQDVLPPSLHPGQGKPYEWRFGLLAAWQQLPPLPAALEAIWDELSLPATTAPPAVAVPSGAAPGKIAAWLRTQDPGMTRPEWVKVGAKIHAEFQGSEEGFNIWCAWSATHPKWIEPDKNGVSGAVEARTVWRSFKLEGRNLATLDKEVRELPADPEEFRPVEPDVPAPSGERGAEPPKSVGELVAGESADQRHNRELLQGNVILQTGSRKSPFFLQPGHRIKEISDAAGLAGVEMGAYQLENLFGPYVAPMQVGNRMVRVEAPQLMKTVTWKRQTAHRIAFRPSKTGGDIYMDKDGHKYINGYRPIIVEPLKPTNSRQLEPLFWLLRRVLDDKGQKTGGTFAIWLVRLYAFCFQNPGVKVKWAPMLYSTARGTGKNTLMETLPALLFGRQYVNPLDHSVLKTRFAGAKFDTTWWVYLSEMYSDDGKKEARTIANAMKAWITDDKMPIEKKGIDVMFIQNYLQFTASSNYEDALYIEEGTNERRWLVGEMCGDELTPSEMAELDTVFHSDDGQRRLHWYFGNYDVRDFNPNEPPPRTLAKARVEKQSRSTWEDKLHDAMEDGAPPFDKDLILLRDITDRLLLGRNVTRGQARTLLMKAGLKEMPRSEAYRHLFCWRNFDQWQVARPCDVRAYMNGAPRPFEMIDDDPLLQ